MKKRGTLSCFIAGLVLCVPALRADKVAATLVDDVYGLGDGGSPLGNLLGGSKELVSLPQEQVEPDEFVEEKSSPSAIVQLPTFQVAEEWKDPLQALCTLPVTEWNLKDRGLEQDLSFFELSGSFVAQIKQLRQQTKAQWLALKKADQKDALYDALQAQMKKVCEKSGFFNTADESLALWVLNVDLAADKNLFLPALLKIITNPSYQSLLITVLGYPRFDKTDARLINGVNLSDQDCMRRLLGLLVASYRREYDTQYQASRDYVMLAYGRVNNLSQSDLLSLEEVEYFGEALAEGIHQKVGFSVDAWQREIASARLRAHEKALSFVEKKLDKMNDRLIHFQARLEAVRVADAVFSYPDQAHASQNVLYDAHVYSLLMGIAYRLGERLLRGEAAVFDPTDMQTIIAQEYKAQRRFRRLNTAVPAGEFGAKGGIPGASSEAFEREARRSFEARLALVLGDLDFMDFSLMVPAVRQALGSYGISKGAEVYKETVSLLSRLNGLVWGVLPARHRTGFAAAFTRQVGIVRGYMESLGLKIGTREDIAEMYRSLMDTIATWSPHTAFSYKSVFALTNAGRRKVIRVQCSAAIYQSLYKVLWLCIGSRLLVVATNQRQAAAAEKLGIKGAVLSGTENVYDGSGALRTDVAAIKPKEAGPSSLLKKAHENFTETLSALAQRSKQGLEKLTRKGDLQGASDEVVNAIGDLANCVDTMPDFMYGIYGQSDKMVATIKALVVYTHYLAEYTNLKLSSFQKAVGDFFDDGVGSTMSSMLKLPIVGPWLKGKISKMILTVNENHTQALRRLDEAKIDLGRAARGELPAEKIVLPRSRTGIAEARAYAASTVEGHSKQLGRDYGLDVAAQVTS